MSTTKIKYRTIDFAAKKKFKSKNLLINYYLKY